MSGLAKYLLENGCEVSGSDIVDSKYVQRLRDLGAHVFIGQKIVILRLQERQGRLTERTNKRFDTGLQGVAHVSLRIVRQVTLNVFTAA